MKRAEHSVSVLQRAGRVPRSSSAGAWLGLWALSRTAQTQSAASGLYLYSLCSSLSKTRPKASEKLTGARRGAACSLKLDVAECIWCDLVDYFRGLGKLKILFI